MRWTRIIYQADRLPVAGRNEIVDYLAAFTFAELKLPHFVIALAATDTHYDKTW